MIHNLNKNTLKILVLTKNNYLHIGVKSLMPAHEIYLVNSANENIQLFSKADNILLILDFTLFEKIDWKAYSNLVLYFSNIQVLWMIPSESWLIYPTYLKNVFFTYSKSSIKKFKTLLSSILAKDTRRIITLTKPKLSPIEKDYMYYLSNGYNSIEISNYMKISYKKSCNLRSIVKRKMGFHSYAFLSYVYAENNGYLYVEGRSSLNHIVI